MNPPTVLNRPQGGVVLDAWGVVHAFGGFTVDTSGAPLWRNGDVARSVVVRRDGLGGWELDAFGGIHSFGRVAAVASPVSWPGWDIARALVMTSRDSTGNLDGRQGYVLDGFGGIHAFGGAPGFGAPATWTSDLARGLDIHVGGNGVPDGGVVLDAWGGWHPFGSYPAVATPTYWPTRDIYKAVHSTAGGTYVVSRFGLTNGLSPGFRPDWTGYGDWGSWDMLRDISLVAADLPGTMAQPVTSQAFSAWQAAIMEYTMSAPVVQQSHSLDCEAAALQVALGARGTWVSQDWILARIGADRRQPILDRSRNILRWGNPYQTFVGDVDGSEPNDTGYGVYYGPIAAAAAAAGHAASGGAGWSQWGVFWEVGLGHPVVIWTDASFQPVAMHHWTSWDGQSIPYAIGEHAVTVIGVSLRHSTVTVVDVADGRVKTFSMAQFVSFWGSFGNMAVAVR